MELKRKDKYIIYKNNDFKVVLSPLGASIVEISINDDVLTLTPINYEDLNSEKSINKFYRSLSLIRIVYLIALCFQSG